MIITKLSQGGFSSKIQQTKIVKEDNFEKYNFLNGLQDNRNTKQYKKPKAHHVFSNTFKLNFFIQSSSPKEILWPRSQNIKLQMDFLVLLLYFIEKEAVD